MIFLINDVNGLFYVWLDCIVVVGVSTVVAGFGLERHVRFFEEKST